MIVFIKKALYEAYYGMIKKHSLMSERKASPLKIGQSYLNLWVCPLVLDRANTESKGKGGGCQRRWAAINKVNPPYK
jgi:hypothetical protein